MITFGITKSKMNKTDNLSVPSDIKSTCDNTGQNSPESTSHKKRSDQNSKGVGETAKDDYKPKRGAKSKLKKKKKHSVSRSVNKKMQTKPAELKKKLIKSSTSNLKFLKKRIFNQLNKSSNVKSSKGNNSTKSSLVPNKFTMGKNENQYLTQSKEIKSLRTDSISESSSVLRTPCLGVNSVERKKYSINGSDQKEDSKHANSAQTATVGSTTPENDPAGFRAEKAILKENQNIRTKQFQKNSKTIPKMMKPPKSRHGIENQASVQKDQFVKENGKLNYDEIQSAFYKSYNLTNLVDKTNTLKILEDEFTGNDNKAKPVNFAHQSYFKRSGNPSCSGRGDFDPNLLVSSTIRTSQKSSDHKKTTQSIWKQNKKRIEKKSVPEMGESSKKDGKVSPVGYMLMLNKARNAKDSENKRSIIGPKSMNKFTKKTGMSEINLRISKKNHNHLKNKTEPFELPNGSKLTIPMKKSKLGKNKRWKNHDGSMIISVNANNSTSSVSEDEAQDHVVDNDEASSRLKLFKKQLKDKHFKSAYKSNPLVKEVGPSPIRNHKNNRDRSTSLVNRRFMKAYATNDGNRRLQKANRTPSLGPKRMLQTESMLDRAIQGAKKPLLKGSPTRGRKQALSKTMLVQGESFGRKLANKAANDKLREMKASSPSRLDTYNFKRNVEMKKAKKKKDSAPAAPNHKIEQISLTPRGSNLAPTDKNQSDQRKLIYSTSNSSRSFSILFDFDWKMTKI